MYSCKVFASLIIHIQLESSVPSLNNENFSAGWRFVLWPQVLGRRGKGGGRDFYISKYLGGGCRIFREHVQAAMWATGNQSLNESLWQEGRAGCHGRWRLALGQTPARPCWHNPLRERKSGNRFPLLHVLLGRRVRCVQVFYISPCLLSLRHSRTS